MKKITLILVFAIFVTKSFAHCPIPQWCPDAPLHQTLCPGEQIDPIEFPSVIAKTLIVTWWTDETRIYSTLTPPQGITVSGAASTPLGDREYAWPVSIKGAPTAIGTHHYTVSNTCGVELLHGSITLNAAIPSTPGTITFSPTSVCIGGTFTASISAVSGTDFYTWTTPESMTDDGSDTTTLTITDAGTTTDSLAISVTATNVCGTSSARTQNITVGIAPTIGTVTPTADRHTTVGTAFSPALTLTANPTGTPTPTIQWYSSTTATNSGGTSMGTTGGANTNTFAPPTAPYNATGVFYYAVVSNSCGRDTTSNTSGRHIVAPRGCHFVDATRNRVNITSGGPVTTSTWTIPARAGVAAQTWSDFVVSPQCSNRTDYNGGTDPNFNVDCRYNNTLTTFPGHYFSWCAVMKYADILCPGTWRVPTVQDFINLDILMGGTGQNEQTRNPSTEVNAQSYTSGTNTTNTAATHRPRGGTWGGSRFTAQAGTGNLTEAHSRHWSSSEYSITNVYFLGYSTGGVNPQNTNGIKYYGLALRCVR